MIVYAFNDAETFARHGFFGMTGGSLSEFRTGDCLISGIPAERRRWGAAMGGRSFESRHLMFDATWKVDASPPLGQLERPFDYLQILRLKADAVREADRRRRGRHLGAHALLEPLGRLAARPGRSRSATWPRSTCFRRTSASPR